MISTWWDYPDFGIVAGVHFRWEQDDTGILRGDPCDSGCDVSDDEDEEG